MQDMQQSRRHGVSLHSAAAATASPAMAALQPRLAKASVLICSHLFWPKLPYADLKLQLPSAQSALCSLLFAPMKVITYRGSKHLVHHVCAKVVCLCLSRACGRPPARRAASVACLPLLLQGGGGKTPLPISTGSLGVCGDLQT